MRARQTPPLVPPLTGEGEQNKPHPSPLLRGEGEQNKPHPSPLLRGEGTVGIREDYKEVPLYIKDIAKNLRKY